MIEKEITLGIGLLNELAGTDFKKESFSLLAQEIGEDGKISLFAAMNRFPLVKDKVVEIKKSIERGEMQRRILADADCVLKKKPSGWAAFTANFIPDILPIITELTKKHDYLVDNGFIVTKDKKKIYK
jgi:hypothetical protein